MTNDSKRSSADRRLATAAGTAVAKTAVATAAAIAVVVAIVVVAVGYVVVVAVGSADMRVVAGGVVATGDDVAVEWALARFPRDARSWAWAMSALVDDAPPAVLSLR